MIEAKYTMLYKDWLLVSYSTPLPHPLPRINATALLQAFSEILDSSDIANNLLTMIGSIFAYYEIGSDEEDHKYPNSEFKDFMLQVCSEYGNYYKEVIENYYKEYQYELNNKRVVTKSDALNISGNNTTSGTGSNTDYELPNKVIPENQYRNTPTSITDNENSSSKTYQNATSRTSTNTTEFNNEFIDLKNKYMNQIRNVYREFAMKFKDCFYQIY